MMCNTIVACPPVRIRLRQPPLNLSEIEQRGDEGDRVANRMIEPEKSNEEPRTTELRAEPNREKSNEEPKATELRAVPRKEQRGAEGDRVANLSRTEKKSNEEPTATELRAEPNQDTRNW